MFVSPKSELGPADETFFGPTLVDPGTIPPMLLPKALSPGPANLLFVIGLLGPTDDT